MRIVSQGHFLAKFPLGLLISVELACNGRSWGEVIFILIVNLQWPVVGRPALCHILGEKSIDSFTRTHFVRCRSSLKKDIKIKMLGVEEMEKALTILAVFIFEESGLRQQTTGSKEFLKRENIDENFIEGCTDKLRKRFQN